jgi:hypothetical protein
MGSALELVLPEKRLGKSISTRSAIETEKMIGARDRN